MTRRRKPEATRTTGETGEKVPRHLAFRPAEGGKGRTGGDQSTSPKEVRVMVPRVGSDLKRDAGVVKTSVAVTGPSCPETRWKPTCV